MELSTFVEPEKPSAMAVEMKRRMDRVRERAVVKAAVAAVGRTGTFPLYGGAVIDAY
jgi:hypothetical protein